MVGTRLQVGSSRRSCTTKKNSVPSGLFILMTAELQMFEIAEKCFQQVSGD